MITPELRQAAVEAMKRRKERMDYASDNRYAVEHRRSEECELVKRIIAARKDLVPQPSGPESKERNHV